jgi:predicted 3-demethylubiquinone-9 3-methyltransferase (glyoxalase superfamily)
MSDIAKNTICIGYDREAEEAARSDASVFPDGGVAAVYRSPMDHPCNEAGEVSALTEALAAGGDEARRAFAARMTMRTIDVAAIDAARRG